MMEAYAASAAFPSLLFTKQSYDLAGTDACGRFAELISSGAIVILFTTRHTVLRATTLCCGP
jgi:hypothetical protein